MEPNQEEQVKHVRNAVLASVFEIAASSRAGNSLIASFLAQSDDPSETWRIVLNKALKDEWDLDPKGQYDPNSSKILDFMSESTKIAQRESIRKELSRFNEEQRIAYESVVLDRTNLFLTGPGGCGKTRVVGAIVKGFAYHHPGVQITISAMTAKIAVALHPLGKTFHKAIGMGLAKESVEYYSEYLKDRSNWSMLRRLERVLANVNFLIVDEISMCDHELLEKFDAAAKTARKSREPFGGIQILFLGDFCQIPPVVKKEDLMKRLQKYGRKDDVPAYTKEYREAVARLEEAHLKDPERAKPAHEALSEELSLPPTYAFESKCWLDAFPSDGSNTVYLTKSYRQKEDGEFAKILNRMRLGEMLEEDYAVLQSFVTCEPMVIEEDGMSYAVLDNGLRVPYLRMRSHRTDVDKINTEALAKIKMPLVRFDWEARFFSHKVFADEWKKLSNNQKKLLESEYDGSFVARLLEQASEPAPRWDDDRGPKLTPKYDAVGLTQAFGRGTDAETDKFADTMQLASPLELKAGCGVYVTENTMGGRLDGDKGIVNGQFGRVIGFTKRSYADEGRSIDPFEVYLGMRSARAIGDVSYSKYKNPIDLSEEGAIRDNIEGPSNDWCPVVEFEETSLDASKQGDASAHKQRYVIPRKRCFIHVPGRGWILTYQFPLTLAGARTAHGSQGMTAMAIEADLEKTFGFGMDYVMLSRLTKLAKNTLVLRGFKRHNMLCHPLVAAFYRHIERCMARRPKTTSEQRSRKRNLSFNAPAMAPNKAPPKRAKTFASK